MKFTDLNSYLFNKIICHLDPKDLSRLSSSCRKFHYIIQNHVKNLKVSMYDEEHIINEVLDGYLSIVLKDLDPAKFLFPNPPFTKVEKLYLNLSDEIAGKINLVKFVKLNQLKLRGYDINLSANKLNSVEHLDIDDPKKIENQVFPNLKTLRIEFDLETLCTIYNATEKKTLEFIFYRTSDIVSTKKKMEQINFEITMTIDLLDFEQLTDSLTDFVKQYQENHDDGKIFVTVYHEGSYEETRRLKESITYLKYKISKQYPFVKFTLKPAERIYTY